MPPPARLLPATLAVVLILVVALLGLAGAEAANLDDLFIVLVYARHLVSTGGLYWNLQDGPVDGFTSPLDLLVKSLAFLLFPEDPVRGSFFLVVLTYLLVPLVAMAAAARLARDHAPAGRRGLALLAGLLAASAPSLAYGTAYLLETPLFVLALTGVVAHLYFRAGGSEPSPLALAGLLLAVALARPEGGPLAVGFLAFHVLERNEATGSVARRRLLGTGLPFAAGMAAYLAWRLALFGTLAPNTYFAKTSASRWNEIAEGWEYLVASLRSSPQSAAALVCSAFVAFLTLAPGWESPTRQRRFLVLSVSGLAALGLVVLSGGDSYGGDRFLAPAHALSGLALVFAAASLRGGGRVVALASAGLLLAAYLLPIVRGATGRVERARHAWPVRSESFACDAEIGRRLTDLLPGGRVAQSDAQRLKYFADSLHVVDLQGLSDRAIAHEVWPGRVRWGKYRPENGLRVAADVWILGYRTEVHATPMARHTLREALGNEALSREYIGYPTSPAVAEEIEKRYRSASLPVCGGYFNFLVRKDRADAFAKAGVLVGSD